MESQRQQKFGKLIQQDLSDIFLRDAKHLFGKTFITVTHVKMSADLSIASIYLSFMLAPVTKEAMLENIEEHNKDIRKILGQRIKNQARVIPSLRFYIDDTAEEAEKIERLLEQIKIPKEDSSK